MAPKGETKEEVDVDDAFAGMPEENKKDLAVPQPTAAGEKKSKVTTFFGAGGKNPKAKALYKKIIRKQQDENA